jgi:ribose-phosphate pyrophosphokinase
MSIRGVKVMALPGSDILAANVCRELEKRLPGALKPEGGLKLTKPQVTIFDNENGQVQIENVRGNFVVVIHTQCSPVNQRLVELFLLLDAIYNSNPGELLLVFPYKPYARSDRKDKPRISVMSVALAHMLNNTFGVRKVLLVDPHNTTAKHYFKPSADEISTIYMFADYLMHYIQTKLGGNKDDVLICYSDGGAAKRFAKLTEITRLPHDYIDKVRSGKEVTIKREINAQGKICIMIDDEICSGGTAILDALALKENGAKQIIMFAPHAPLSKEGKTSEELIAALNNSPIDAFVFTDTIPVEDKIKGHEKFKVLSVAGLLAEAIKQTIEDDSVTQLHEPENVGLYRPQY